MSELTEFIPGLPGTPAASCRPDRQLRTAAVVVAVALLALAVLGMVTGHTAASLLLVLLAVPASIGAWWAKDAALYVGAGWIATRSLRGLTVLELRRPNFVTSAALPVVGDLLVVHTEGGQKITLWSRQDGAHDVMDALLPQLANMRVDAATRARLWPNS